MRVRATIRGRVQGVFFRDSTRREASSRGLAGWVCNLPDGSVEAVFEGDRAEIDALLEFCRQGPPDARVESVEASDEPPEGLIGFEVR